jgi:Raf kinase inhibitor-like YbhB/YbcL family protein
MAFELMSSAFTNGGEIPAEYTCDGDDRSPPLVWRGVPGGTVSFALIVDDPDAPDPAAPRRTWVHWVLYDIDAGTTQLAAGASSGALPAGGREGTNDSRQLRYSGPCPPIGRHRYFHRLYALDRLIGPLTKNDKTGLLRAMEGHVLATAELMGTYARGGSK